MRQAVIVIVAMTILTHLSAQDGSSRIALVIGNGAYSTVQRLDNPPNDAADMADKLTGLGFSVTRLVNAKLSEMEAARQKFAENAKAASMRIFYYAGHGIQSDGTNWLLPTDADVKQDYELKLKAFSAQAVLDGLKAAGPGVNIIILDACRDNPFKASSRSAGASRGLAVMGTSGSLIVYATAPGSTAADGKGRNGVFTQALLGRLDSPGLSLQEIMTNVSADVADLTKGDQEPWIQANLTKMVYLVTPEEARARFAANLTTSQGELDAANAQLAKLRSQAVAEQDAAKKAALEVEIRKQAALKTQKELETEALKVEAVRQAQAAKDQAEMGARLASFKAEALNREDLIRKAAEGKRKELEALQTGQRGFLPFILTIEASRGAKTDLAKQYDASFATISKSVAATYDQKLAALATWTMDPWENDREYRTRVATEHARLSGEKQAALADAFAAGEQKKQSALLPFTEAETRALDDLKEARMTYKGKAVKIEVGTFDRDAKSFPVTLSSASTDFAYSAAFSYSVKADTTEELKRRFLEFDAWQKAGALFGEIDVSVYAADGGTYLKIVDDIRFKAVDGSGERLLFWDSPQNPSAVFSGSADWQSAKPAVSYLRALAAEARIEINGKDSGRDRVFVLAPKPGSYTIRAILGDGTALEERRNLSPGSAETVRFATTGNLDGASLFRSGFEFLVGMNVRTDTREGFTRLRAAAEAGYAPARFYVGRIYELGEKVYPGVGLRPDPVEAQRWNQLALAQLPELRRGAAQGDAIYQYILGRNYDDWKNIKEDYAEAARWYRLAADQGYFIAQYRLGIKYYRGEGVEQNSAEAAKWIRLAADQGYSNAQNDLGILYRFGEGVAQDLAEAVKWYRLAADQGDSDARYNLGTMFDNGLGLTKDLAEALKWYHLAAEQGHADAQNCLGSRFEYGTGTTKDFAEAMKWYRLAAEQGHVEAQNSLGLMFENGNGTAKDFAEALKWYRLAAEQGHATAQHKLGLMFENGNGAAKDFAEALKWYRLAAEQGHAAARHKLGVTYYYGTGVAQDNAEALKWFRLAADQGQAVDQNFVGVMYYNGTGVVKDYAEALKWFRLAADKGEPFAQSNLGLMFEKGTGIALDYAEAMKWYRLAAAQNNSSAQNNLGRMYYNGAGIAQDYAEAMKWYRLAAEQGYSFAQYNLGLMFQNGSSVEQDYVEAMKWYSLAADQGYSPAKDSIASISLKMTAPQIEEAKLRVARWRVMKSFFDGF